MPHKAKEVLRKLKRAGFEERRQSGSHLAPAAGFFAEWELECGQEEQAGMPVSFFSISRCKSC